VRLFHTGGAFSYTLQPLHTFVGQILFRIFNKKYIFKLKLALLFQRSINISADLH